MKEKEEYLIYRQIIKSYLDDHLHTQVKNITTQYLNDNLEDAVEHIIELDRKDNNSRLIRFFFKDHEFITGVLIVILGLIILGISFMLFVGFSHNLEIDKLNNEARVCVETGYGCKSDQNNTNTDIKYDNTPIVDVKVKNDN